MGMQKTNLLREAIRAILREEAGPDKSSALADRIIETNRGMWEVGLPFQIVIEISGGADFEAQIMLKRTDVGRGDEELTRIMPGSTIVSDWIEENMKSPKREAALEISKRLPYGSILTAPPSRSDGKCLSSQVVQLTRETRPGWGPLLYDIALEAATESRGGLTPDRLTVTPEAQRIWRAYDTARPDVSKRQLDIDPLAMALSDKTYSGIKPDRITPDDPTDDCGQVSSWEAADGNWSSSPLSRTYSKSPGVIPKLEAAGAIVRR